MLLYCPPVLSPVFRADKVCMSSPMFTCSCVSAAMCVCVCVCVCVCCAGFKKTIKHLDGHEVTLSSSAITKPGDWQQYVGEGMPVHNSDGQHGDLWVQYSIAFPTSLSEEQKAATRKLLEGTNMPLPNAAA